jgi:hypothetical protein
LTKRRKCGQIVADVFGMPVALLDSAKEGCAWGAILLARYRFERCNGSRVPWTDFLQSISIKGHARFCPEKEAVHEYQGVCVRYQKLWQHSPCWARRCRSESPNFSLACAINLRRMHRHFHYPSCTTYSDPFLVQQKASWILGSVPRVAYSYHTVLFSLFACNLEKNFSVNKFKTADAFQFDWQCTFWKAGVEYIGTLE